MKKSPPKPSDEINKMRASIIQKRNDIVKGIQELNAAINNLPPGQDKQSLCAVQDELKHQSGLFPDHEPSRWPREDSPWQQFEAKAIELKDAARKWTAAGRFDKAEQCLGEAHAAEREAALRRTTKRKRT